MAVGNEDQKAKWGKRWAAMAITEPGAGSDSKNISTTAVLEGDEWVLNGEKIYVTDGDRCDCVVVWATLNKDMGKTAIRSFISREGHAWIFSCKAREETRYPSFRYSNFDF